MNLMCCILAISTSFRLCKSRVYQTTWILDMPFVPATCSTPPAGSQEEKVKDTVLINGIGFVAACVPWTLMNDFCVWQPLFGRLGRLCGLCGLCL